MVLSVERSHFRGCYSGQFGGGIYAKSVGNSITDSCFVECSAADSRDDSGHAGYLCCRNSGYITQISCATFVLCPIAGIGYDSTILVEACTEELTRSNFTANKVKSIEVFQSNSPTNLPATFDFFFNCTCGTCLNVGYYGDIEQCIFISNPNTGVINGVVQTKSNGIISDSIFYDNGQPNFELKSYKYQVKNCYFCKNTFPPPSGTERCGEFTTHRMVIPKICGKIPSNPFSKNTPTMNSLPFFIGVVLITAIR